MDTNRYLLDLHRMIRLYERTDNMLVKQFAHETGKSYLRSWRMFNHW